MSKDKCQASVQRNVLGVTASHSNSDITCLLRGRQENTERGFRLVIVIFSVRNLTITSLISPIGLISLLMNSDFSHHKNPQKCYSGMKSSCSRLILRLEVQKITLIYKAPVDFSMKSLAVQNRK